MRPSIENVATLNQGETITGAEIGVENGAHAFEMLENLPLTKLYLVDAYKPHYDKDQSVVDRWRKDAKDLLSDFVDRIVWLIGDSLDFSDTIDDESLDFVYIDADHAATAVYNDIVAWSKKVRVGGIVAGHDFSVYEETRQGVIKYALENDIEVYFRQQDWWFIKS
jgi:predicted O-methyltransferase YrrM